MAVPYYKTYANAFALKQLIKKVDIPDMKLMIGSAECLEPLPLLIYKDLGVKQASAVMKPYNQLTYEEAAETLQGGGLTVNDFPGNTLYLGDAIGEI